MGDITLLLEHATAGDAEARDALFSRVYPELCRIARHKLAGESGLTQIDASALVHEAYLRLAGTAELPAASRRAFFAYAARVMRSVVVDIARERRAMKRGSGATPVTLVTRDAPPDRQDPEVEALDVALQDLRKVDERCHRIVELRYFAGMSIEEIATVLDLSSATVKRDWRKARAFLYHALQE